MRNWRVTCLSLVFSPLCTLGLIACSGNLVNDGQTKACGACVATTDCVTGDECSLLAGGAFCAPTCMTNEDCANGQVCSTITTAEGTGVLICHGLDGTCSSSTSGSPDSGTVTNQTPDSGTVTILKPDSGTVTNQMPDSGTTSSGGSCPGYATPDESGGSCVCQSGHTCGANNCYGGYYCDLATNHCVAPPSSCASGTADAGTGTRTDAGTVASDAGTITTIADAGPFSSSVTESGGTESNLFFAIVGDTRPYTEDDTSHYPASPPLPACTSSTDGYVGTDDAATCGAITTIFQDIQDMNPRPPFVVSTGDYQYVTPGHGDAVTQLGYYQTARKGYSGIEFPAMGNHECDGFTASNCANGCPSGDTCSGSNTENFLEFQSLFLGQIGETLPYYTRTITAADGSWTAHFIFVAPNYWDSTQESWFTSQLAAAGTSSTSNYIFVIHHEDATAGAPTSLSTIESAEASVETISIVGHSHEWAHGGSNPKELLVGNGGVPSSSAKNLGYTTITRQSNGQLLVNAYDFLTNKVVETYTVTP